MIDKIRLTCEMTHTRSRTPHGTRLQPPASAMEVEEEAEEEDREAAQSTTLPEPPSDHRPRSLHPASRRSTSLRQRNRRRGQDRRGRAERRAEERVGVVRRQHEGAAARGGKGVAPGPGEGARGGRLRLSVGRVDQGPRRAVVPHRRAQPVALERDRPDRQRLARPALETHLPVNPGREFCVCSGRPQRQGGTARCGGRDDTVGGRVCMCGRAGVHTCSCDSSLAAALVMSTRPCCPCCSIRAAMFTVSPYAHTFTLELFARMYPTVHAPARQSTHLADCITSSTPRFFLQAGHRRRERLRRWWVMCLLVVWCACACVRGGWGEEL